MKILLFYIFLHISLICKYFLTYFIISSFIRLLRTKIQEIISNLDTETSISIGKAQNIMQNETLKKNLIFISVNFSFIAHTITKLKTKNMSLNDSMQIVESTIEKLKLVSGPIDVVKKKIHVVTKKKFKLY
jgi:hypothetical protein